ncbi:MAG: peptidoglycan DD-metalloendopeptidase family protein [Lachnospiraceae bacterium]|nr:peptidoglycan DD-metalloendopeptidase family protein [Lachnospiraceae bacterium]
MKKRNLCIIIITMILIVSFFVKDVIAQTVEELRENRDLVEKQIVDNNVQLDELQSEISELMLQIQELNNQIYGYEVQVSVLESEIKELNVKISQLELKLKDAQEKYNKRKEMLIARVVAQYEAGETVYLDVLLNSKSLVDFISNYYLLEQILEYDQELLEGYLEQEKIIKDSKTKLETYKEELKTAKKSQESSSIALGNIKVRKNNQVTDLSEHEQELQLEIEQYQEEQRAIEVELLMLLTGSVYENYVGGVLLWPVPGYYNITSEFGMRVHPIYGVYRLHSGLDVGAPTGSLFIAANDGTVVKAEYTSGYGNMVVIDHGGGLSTLYGHGSEILVKAGDTVKAGQPVLKVGSTGVSTGPHAHFEVRVNGRYVNPIDYVLSTKN